MEFARVQFTPIDAADITAARLTTEHCGVSHSRPGVHNICSPTRSRATAKTKRDTQAIEERR